MPYRITQNRTIMGKESFLIYKSFYKPISKLSDKQLGRLFRAIFKYQLDGEVEVEEDIEMAFEFFKARFELDEDKYQGIVERNRNNGRNAATKREAAKNNKPVAPNGSNDTQEPQSHPVGASGCQSEPVAPNGRLYDSDSDNDNDNDVIKENSKKKTAKRFSPPTVEEVQAYVEEKGYSVDAERFVNFYSAKGWMIGKNKMQNWKSAVATWQKGENENGNQRKQTDGGYGFRDYPPISRPTGKTDDGAGSDAAQQPSQDYSERF